MAKGDSSFGARCPRQTRLATETRRKNERRIAGVEFQSVISQFGLQNKSNEELNILRTSVRRDILELQELRQQECECSSSDVYLDMERCDNLIRAINRILVGNVLELADDVESVIPNSGKQIRVKWLFGRYNDEWIGLGIDDDEESLTRATVTSSMGKIVLEATQESVGQNFQVGLFSIEILEVKEVDS